MDDTTDQNIQPVSYKKILPKYEVWPSEDVDYIDLQYNPSAFKFPNSESQSKFNSLPNIKSGRKSKYISAIEAITLPKCEAKENLAMESPEKEDNLSKLSETTTVVIHESPRGIANDAFEDDEDVLDSSKRCDTASPSQSNVSYSSNDSSVKIPIPEVSSAARKKQLESEGYQSSIIDNKLQKKWRGEKLYISFPRGRDQHLKRFVWWMICLILLAGAITVAALIGVGVIKLPSQSSISRVTTNDERSDHLGPRLGFVGSAEGSILTALTSSTTKSTTTMSTTTTTMTTTTTTMTTTTTTESTTTTTMSTTTTTKLTTTTTMLTTTTSSSTSSSPSMARLNLDSVEGSGQQETIDISENEFGSGMDVSDQSNEEDEERVKVAFLNNEDLMPELEEVVKETEETIKENENSELDKELDGSGEVELIITLPDLAAAGSNLLQNPGGEFEITRKKKGFETGEEVFKALVHFLLPDAEEKSLESDHDKSFKDLFNIFAS